MKKQLTTNLNKARMGSLRVDQKYEAVSVDHLDDVTTCDNCGNIIRNLYTIKGTVDNKEYGVGSECVSTLTMLNPLASREMTRKLNRKLRFIRELKKSAVVIINPNDSGIGASFWFYMKATPSLLKGEWSHNWKGRGSFEEYAKIIESVPAVKVRKA